MIGRVHQEGERRLEDFGDFLALIVEREAGLDQRDQRRDAKARAGEIGVEPAQRLDETRPRGRSPRAPRATRSRAASRRDRSCRRETRPGRNAARKCEARSVSSTLKPVGARDDRREHRGRPRLRERRGVGRRSVQRKSLTRGRRPARRRRPASSARQPGARRGARKSSAVRSRATEWSKPLDLARAPHRKEQARRAHAEPVLAVATPRPRRARRGRRTARASPAPRDRRAPSHKA